MKKLLIYLFFSITIGVMSVNYNAKFLMESKSNRDTDDSLPNSEKSLILDNAALLQQTEVSALTSKLEELNQKHHVNLVIVTVNDTGSRTNMDFADEYYHFNRYGINGAVLLINMNPRGWYISTSGNLIRYFTDYGVETIGSGIRADLSSGNYNAAFEKFITISDDFITQGKKGRPYDQDNLYKTNAGINEKIFAMLLLAFAIALFTIRIMISMMKTIRKQSGANEYEKELQLSIQSDMFLYSRTESKKINKSTSGSSSHSDKQGHKHGGGGGSF